MFLWIFGVPQTCFRIALTWSSGKGQTLGPQRIHQEFLEHLMQCYQEKMRMWPMSSDAIHRHVKKDVFSKLYEQVCVGEKAKMLLMITEIIKGKDCISHHELD